MGWAIRQDHELQILSRTLIFSTIKKREVLILGSGPGSKKHSDAIERFIKVKKPFVIALNDQKTINEKLIDIRVACHTLRLASDLNRFKNTKINSC